MDAVVIGPLRRYRNIFASVQCGILDYAAKQYRDLR
jgi:hypothetical protein